MSKQLNRECLLLHSILMQRSIALKAKLFYMAKEGKSVVCTN
jgi:hypothetical protein